MGSWKTEAELAAEGLPELLRELAAALEAGAPGSAWGEGLLEGLPGRDWRKLVLVAERRSSGLSVKLKAKRSDEVKVPTPDAARLDPGRKPQARADGKGQAGRDKYRELKKSLQAEYKALQAASGEGRLPGAEALESFLSLAELMGRAGQPVSGAKLAEISKANTAFLDDCQALKRACSARDAAALAEVLERLARRKSACHAQFR